MMETKRRKNQQKNSLKSPSTTNGMDVFDDFYTDHPFVDWYNWPSQQEKHLTFFKKQQYFGLDDYQFLECRTTQIRCGANS